MQDRRESNRLYLRMKGSGSYAKCFIHYEISEDLMKPHKVENMVLNDGTLKLPLETFKKDNAHNAMYSIPIFNFNNMEQLQAIVKA